MSKEPAPFGSWTSSITAELVAGQALRFDLLQHAGDTLYWSEQRPSEGGRTVIVAQRSGEEPRDLLPPPFSARSSVHEYGGGAFIAWRDDVFFVNGSDQAVYRAAADTAPVRVASEAGMRCADMARDPNRRRLIAVAEQHEEGSHEAPENLLVEIDLDGDPDTAIEPFVAGRDFYAYPRFSQDGSHLCWIEWDLPWMPWEHSRLMAGAVGADGGIEEMQHIAGGDGGSIFQPTWGPDGRLYFVSDESGWGNLMVWDGGEVRPLTRMDADFGRTLFGLAMSSFAFAGDRLIASYCEGGEFKLAEIDTATGVPTEVPNGFRQHGALCSAGEGVAFLATGDTLPPSVVHLPLTGESAGAPQILRRAMAAEIDVADISTGELVHVPLPEGDTVHALYYPPTNRAFTGEAGTAPPLIAAAHGGPTGMADRGLKLKIQYWTSRGFAFVDVDYRGSAGYGTAYRDALNGQWGVRDVEDVIAVSRWLVEQGLADGDRLLISGGSAGGYTVLSALTFHDVFAAGASYYGIGDLQKLLDLTHKLESGYLYNLTGTEPGATEAVFRERSPLFHAERISVPVIFFQGLEDKVVPPGQSREMVEALKAQGIPVAYLEFEGEGHGFRQAATSIAALNAEYAFFAQVLGLEPQEDLPELNIFNGEALSSELRK